MPSCAWVSGAARSIQRPLASALPVVTARLVVRPGPADHAGVSTGQPPANWRRHAWLAAPVLVAAACAVGAIVADGVVDSRLCISYWTIEHRGEVPADRRAGNGDWIFGCDVCQQVCPWNETHARPVDAERFERRDDLRGLDPLAILAMDETAFRSAYSGTALMRAKWEGMRRNACIVLGNRRDPGALDGLRAVRDDPDPVVRSHAVWAIDRIAGGSR